MTFKFNWDAIGIATSVICAIHCAFLPILATVLPALSGVHNHIFEWGMIVLAFVVGIYSLRHGFKKHHHNKLPYILFGLGFALLITKQFFHEYEIYFLLPAVILIVTAHFKNFKLSRHKNCHSAHHSHN
ncbi:MAG TPA: MerC domain-containing protein [Ferruginibacter sp.]|nr:MerC domain-containing protein [Ferruginibacter sp.]HRE63109.1 MerC domain-containing protein [Ferruginibacter sp.]